uniref:Uncharacterized protein n=1 Tax=Glossina pallidipes TaxID=7398 RepID=A0A1B0A6F9_GLOPL
MAMGTLTCPQPIPQETTPITFQIPLRSQTNGPPPSPLQASLPSSPPAHKKPGLSPLSLVQEWIPNKFICFGSAVLIFDYDKSQKHTPSASKGKSSSSSDCLSSALIASRLLRLLSSSVPSELEFSPVCDCVGLSGRVTFAAASSLKASISFPKLRGSIELMGMGTDGSLPWSAPST